MTPAVLSALPMHPAPLAPALAGLPATFTPSTRKSTAVNVPEGRKVQAVMAMGAVEKYRQDRSGPAGYSPGTGKFTEDVFEGLDPLYPVRL